MQSPIILTPEEQRKRIPTQLLQGQDQLSNLPTKLTLILGPVGSGKTSLAYHLTSNLTVKSNGSSHPPSLHPKTLHRHASISERHNPNPKPPTLFPGSLLDCTSFNNYKKMPVAILSHYFFSRIFQQASEYKFILTLTMAALQNAKAADYTNMVANFVGLFRDVGAARESVCLVVTKWEGWKKEDVVGKLQDVLDANPKMGAAAREIMQALTNPDRVFLFDNASSLSFAKLNGKKLAEDIDKSLKYWRSQPGAISSNFMMGFISDEEKKLVEDYIKNTNDCVASIFKIVGDTLEDIKKRVAEAKKLEKGFNEWDKKVADNNRYEGRKYDFGEMEDKPAYHNQLKFMRKAIQAVEKSGLINSAQKRTIAQAKQLFISLLKLFMSILNLTEVQKSIIQQICFIALRKIQQSCILVIQQPNPKPIGTPLSAQTLCTALISFSSDYPKLQLQYVRNFPLPSNLPDSFYSQSQSLISSHLHSDPKLYNKLSTLNSLRSRLHIQSNPSSAGELIISAINNSEKFNEEKNRNSYVVVEKKMYLTLAEICEGGGLWREAAEVYKVVNHVNKVMQCLGELEKQQGPNWDIEMERARYMRANARHEALGFYQQALVLGDEDQTKKTQKEIDEYFEKKGQETSDYKKRISNGEFYNRLSGGFSLADIQAKIRAIRPHEANVNAQQTNGLTAAQEIASLGSQIKPSNPPQPPKPPQPPQQPSTATLQPPPLKPPIDQSLIPSEFRVNTPNQITQSAANNLQMSEFIIESSRNH